MYGLIKHLWLLSDKILYLIIERLSAYGSKEMLKEMPYGKLTSILMTVNNAFALMIFTATLKRLYVDYLSATWASFFQISN